MQLFLFCLLSLSLATMVVTAPVRAQRENVLSFISDAMEKARTTEMIPANITGSRHPPSKPVTGDDSEDMSDAKSAEDSDAKGFNDAVRVLDSHEITVPAVEEKAPPRRDTAADQGGVGLMDTSSAVVEDSDEGPMLGAAYLPGRQSSHLPGSSRGGADLHRTAGGAGELSRSSAPAGSRELQDGDSAEQQNNGRLGNTDYDETREDNSLEAYPLVGPEHTASS